MGGSGIRFVVGAVASLCNRCEAGSLLKWACGAMDLGDCTVGTWGILCGPGIASGAIRLFYR